MARMRAVRAGGEVLSGKEGVVIRYWEYAALLVEVVRGSHEDGACADTKCSILDGLELGGVGAGEVWRPGWTGVVEGTAN